MPRIHPETGLIAAGVGGGVVSIPGTDFRHPGGIACWLDADRLLFAGPREGRWVTLCFDRRTGEVSLHRDFPATFLAAGGGRWGGMDRAAGATYVGDPPLESWRRLSPPETDNRGAMGPDGTIATTDDTFTGFVLHAPDGSQTGPVAVGHAAYGLTVVGPQQALWPVGHGWHTLNLPVPLSLGSPARRACWCVVAGKPWIVHGLDGVGLVARPIDSRQGVVIERGPTFHYDAVAFNGAIRATWATSTGERPEEIVKRDVALSHLEDLIPEPTPKPAPIPLDQIDPLDGKWVVAWYEQKGNVPPDLLPPGNAQVAVRGHAGLVPRPTIVTGDTAGAVNGQILGYRVGSEEQPDIAKLEAIAAEKAAAGYRIWFYWDGREVPRWPTLPPGTIVELNAYCGVDESLDAFAHNLEAQIIAAAARYEYLVLCCQAFTTNVSLLREPSAAIPIVVRLAKKYRGQVIGLTVFNNTGRDDAIPGSPTFGEGGLTANPQLRPHWEKVFSGVTGLPAFLQEQKEPPVGEVYVGIQDYDRVTSRRDPRGMLVRFDAGSSHPITRIECRMEDGEPPIVVAFPVGRGSDGRYVRALAFKPVRTGAFHFTLTAWDATGATGSARSATPVTVTEDPVGEDPPPSDIPALSAVLDTVAQDVDAQRPGLRSSDLPAYNRLVAQTLHAQDDRWGLKSAHGPDIAVSKSHVGFRLTSGPTARTPMHAFDYVRDETGVGPEEWHQPDNRNYIRPDPIVHADLPDQWWIQP